MENLIQMLDALISNLEGRNPATGSLDWYLLNNLRRFKEVAESTHSRDEFENAARVFTRFCIDSMDWDDPLFKAATAITEQAKFAGPA